MDSIYSATLHSFPNKFPSSKFEKLIITQVLSWDDVAYRMYETADCVASAAENGRDMWANGLEKFLEDINSCERNYFSWNRYVDEIPLLMLWYSNEDTLIFFCDWWPLFNAFLSMCKVDFCTTYGQNKTCGFDTEGLLSVAGLCGVVGSSSWLIKYLIGRTGNIWSTVYINAQCIYLSETRACTII